MKTIEHLGFTATITIHNDQHHGAPWEENDGHGIVSGWERRDKRAGERILHSDRHSKRFYDMAATMRLAKRDGWGLGDESKAKLAAKLGKPVEFLTHGEIVAQAVEDDFEYLRSWCADEWQWQGYTTEIESPDGEITDGDSCWGFEGTRDGIAYMLSEAESNARAEIERMAETVTQTQLAECYP